VAFAINLARLITARRQAKVGADLPGTAKPGRIVDRGHEGDCCHRPDPGHGHQTGDDLRVSGDCDELPIIGLDLREDRALCLEQGIDQTR
jgi:hypothetical protein